MNDQAAIIVGPEDVMSRLPRRFGWLKRILVGSGIVLVGVGVLRWRVGIVAQDRLASKIAQLRAAGEPLDPEDFNSEPVPDELNAVIPLKQAAEAFVNWSGRGVSFSDIIRNPSLCSTQPDQVYALINNNQRALQLLREARLRPDVDWGLRWPSPMLETGLPYTITMVDLGRLLCASAIYHDSRGEHGEAVEALRDALSLANLIGQKGFGGGGFLDPTLGAIATSQIVERTIQRLEPTLLRNERNASRRFIPPDARRQYEALIRDLLDEAAIRRSWVRSCQFERAYLLDTAPVVFESPVAPFLEQPSTRARLSWMIRGLLYHPVDQVDLARLLDDMSAYVHAASASTYLQAESLLPEPVASDRVREQRTYLFGVYHLASLNRTLRQARIDLSTRRLAAAGLAIHLFETDNGRRPAELQELVPRYLPKVPTDLRSVSGEEILYFPTGPQAKLAVRDPRASRGVGSKDQRTTPYLAAWQVFRVSDRARTAPHEATNEPTRSDQGADQGDDVQDQPRDAEPDQPADQHP